MEEKIKELLCLDYGLSFLPGGFFVELADTAATSIWEDEIKNLKTIFMSDGITFGVFLGFNEKMRWQV